MECPHCGKNDNAVIDSRLSKDGIAIRRRRQCLLCSNRFTTYESTEERSLPFLIRKKVEHGSVVNNLNEMLTFMSSTLELLSGEIENLIVRIEKREKAQAAEESRKRARERTLAKRQAASLVMNETVFKIIKRYKRGIDISKLKDKTGFNVNKVRRIVFELRKQGKIKGVRKGFYQKL